MGTQGSYGGPADVTPLLPAWAVSPPLQVPQVPEQPLVPSDAGPLLPEAPVTGPLDPADAGAVPPPNNPIAPQPNIPRGSWSGAKSSFSRAVSSGTRQGFRRAAKSYTRAGGGSGRAAGASRGGNRSTVLLGNFLASAATRGLQATLRGLGLQAVVGRDVNEVLAAIAGILAPDGATKEEAAARDAISETLQNLFERFMDEGRDLTALENMTREDIAAAIETCIGSYIYNRWLGDLGIKIEEHAITATEAVRLEREMREFVRETVRLDMSRVDVLTLDWQSQAGQLFVDNIYRDAYSLFGGEA
ncbi:MAG TPA: Qat anti-phage system associated protein QatB [Phycisphaerae bacterium]|nr:Qat anti-phage system associated protein QatB [Phycisphaerae bacterium]